MLMTIWFLWTIQMKLTLCSLVVDKWEQDGIHYEEYCPKMKYCAEGTHVMCMEFNPNQTSAAGPKCSEFKNLSITHEVANKLLYLVNEIRARAAQGLETGKNNQPLPKAHGLFKLEWDNELATFAQVLANTCTFKTDMCRATSRFPTPGQVISGVRFSLGDWFPLQHPTKFSVSGLTQEKIEYAAIGGFKTWYSSKQHVTPDMILRLPDFYAKPTQTLPKYLQLVDGSTTHMGCGLSAYVEYTYYGIRAQTMPLSNTIHIVCNFSSRPQKGVEVYSPENPYDNPDEGHYSKCGCPADAEEDEVCLCSLIDDRKSTSSCGKDESCAPALVLLPIFTVEDVPPDALKRHGRSSLKPTGLMGHNEADWARNDLDDKFSLAPEYIQRVKFENNPKFSLVDMPNAMAPNQFASKLSHTSNVDVIPRKDFTEAKKMVEAYLNQKNLGKQPLNNAEFHNILKQTLLDTSNKKTLPDHFEDPIMNKQPTEDVTLNEELDDKLTTLLDTLEQEVKHIEMGENQKEIFNARIRKIYGTAVGKIPEFTESNSETYDSMLSESGSEDYIENAKEEDKKNNYKEMYENEDKVNGLNSGENDKYASSNIGRSQDVPMVKESYVDSDDYENTFNMLDAVKSKLANNKDNLRNIINSPKLSHSVDSKAKTKLRNRLKGRSSHRQVLNGNKIWKENLSDEQQYREFRLNDDNRGVHNRHLNKINEFNSLNKHIEEKRLMSSSDIKSPISYYRDIEKQKQFNEFVDNPDDDPLSFERRKYYQEKLDKLVKQRAQLMNKHRGNVEKVRARRLLNNVYDLRVRPIEAKSPSFYMPNRARSHSYS